MQSYSVSLVGAVRQAQFDFLDDLNTLVTNDKAPYSAYSGYVDPLLPDGPEAYWGSNLPRLQQIKKKIDPQNVFRNPQTPSPAS
jgi:hypothetical protein